MMNFCALKLFGSFIRKLKKAMDCINHVIYTCEQPWPITSEFNHIHNMCLCVYK